MENCKFVGNFFAVVLSLGESRSAISWPVQNQSVSYCVGLQLLMVWSTCRFLELYFAGRKARCWKKNYEVHNKVYF